MVVEVNMDIHVEQYDEKDATVVEILDTSLNIFNFSALSHELKNSLRRTTKPRVVFDLKNIKHIDSVGIGLLTLMKNMVAHDGADMAIACDNDGVLKVIELLNMSGTLKSYRTLRDAINKPE